jgi:hypothetical protein
MDIWRPARSIIDSVSQALSVLLSALLLAAAGTDAARGGRTILQQQRTLAPRGSGSGSPTPTASGSGGSGSGSGSSGGSSGGSGSGSPTSNPKVFDPLGPSPFKDTECKVLPQGQTYDVRPASLVRLSTL